MGFPKDFGPIEEFVKLCKAANGRQIYAGFKASLRILLKQQIAADHDGQVYRADESGLWVELKFRGLTPEQWATRYEPHAKLGYKLRNDLITPDLKTTYRGILIVDDGGWNDVGYVYRWFRKVSVAYVKIFCRV